MDRIDSGNLYTQTDRIEWIDVAKGIAMLCIIAGHMQSDIINRIVFTFHVPIFFLISGYFLSRTDDIGLFTKKKIRGILIPYAFTSFLLIAVRIVKDLMKGNWNTILLDCARVLAQALYGSGSTENKTLFGISSIGAIWFLLALMWSLVLVKIFIDKKYGFLWITVIAIISYITSKYVWLPWSIQAGGTAAIFVYFGAYYKEKKHKVEFKWWGVCLGIVVLITEIALNIKVSIVRNYYKYTIVSAIGAILISYAVLWIAKICGNNQFLKSIFCFWGKNSIIVLCYHLVIIRNIPCSKIYAMLGSFPVIVQYLSYFIFQLLLIALLTWITLKCKWISKIFNR